jgi:hypothetical protein
MSSSVKQYALNLCFSFSIIVLLSFHLYLAALMDFSDSKFTFQSAQRLQFVSLEFMEVITLSIVVD